uniref:BCL2 associated X, apoptosis regulator n=1 Tax=Junco hyemalis TaxID=40217 RepID=A0A8C5IA19_JUNHY
PWGKGGTQGQRAGVTQSTGEVTQSTRGGHPGPRGSHNTGGAPQSRGSPRATGGSPRAPGAPRSWGGSPDLGVTQSTGARRFVRDRVQRCGDPQAVALSEAELGQPQPSSPDTKRLSECLRRIGDELDSNMELQRMIEQVGCDAPKKLFFRVAREMFADGTFNWGRVVALFYFACKLVLKALCTKVPELVQTILRWTMEYLQEHVLAWIQAQGGWVRPQTPIPRGADP